MQRRLADEEPHSRPDGSYLLREDLAGSRRRGRGESHVGQGHPGTRHGRERCRLGLGVSETDHGQGQRVFNWFQGELMLLIFNITFFFVYLSIPIASYLIVSGASRPFRNF